MTLKYKRFYMQHKSFNIHTLRMNISFVLNTIETICPILKIRCILQVKKPKGGVQKMMGNQRVSQALFKRVLISNQQFCISNSTHFFFKIVLISNLHQVFVFSCIHFFNSVAYQQLGKSLDNQLYKCSTTYKYMCVLF